MNIINIYMCCGLEVKTVGINQPLLLLIRQNYQNLIIITGIAVKIVKTKWCSTTRKKPSENTAKEVSCEECYLCVFSLYCLFHMIGDLTLLLYASPNLEILKHSSSDL